MPNPRIPLLDHGFVELLGHMGGDDDVVASARISYDSKGRTPDADRNLIRYMMRHRHTSPFEQVTFRFHIRAPIFVARQWMRHRTASINEESGRYKELTCDYYTPPVWRGQDPSNKQGSDGALDKDVQRDALQSYQDATSLTPSTYQLLLQDGVARELARICLPLSTYTEWIWKMDLHNLFHFLKLRCDSHAQHEIRVYADAIADIIQPLVPLCFEAWVDYSRDAVTFSRQEQTVLSDFVQLWLQAQGGFDYHGITNPREKEEFNAKIKHLMDLA